jgi:threonine/homoserine/homoserine lactone efflux protein
MSSLPVDPHLYLTFLGVMAVMAITPGPANLFSVANGVARGKAGAMLGVPGLVRGGGLGSGCAGRGVS